jgi:hypothetical protein
MGQLMWVRKLPGNSTEDENGGLSTAEPGMGILKENIRGCEWRSECCRVRNGHPRDYMPVLSIYLKE